MSGSPTFDTEKYKKTETEKTHSKLHSKLYYCHAIPIKFVQYAITRLVSSHYTDMSAKNRISVKFITQKTKMGACKLDIIKN